MKSKKAEEYLNRIYKGGIKIKAYHRASANKAVEIAEEEMKEKAIEVHKSICKRRCEYNCDSCLRMDEFINELNK